MILSEIEYDVVIVGAGVVGCAIARELVAAGAVVCVIEKGSDVAQGTSCRNSGVVHAGFNSPAGSLQADLCVAGNRKFEAMCQTLAVPYKKTGKLVVGFDEQDLTALRGLLAVGETNGCPDLSIVGEDFIRRQIPECKGVYALFSPHTAVVSPYGLTIALAENALVNGAVFLLGQEVTGIHKRDEDSAFIVQTDKSTVSCRVLVNAAGLFADKISAMAGDTSYRIYPCRGEYYVLDKRVGDRLSMPVYPVPRQGDGGLGVHLTPTVDGNVLIGPSADYIEQKENNATTGAVLRGLAAEASSLLPGISEKDFIRVYAGVRPKLTAPGQGGYASFVIGESEIVAGLINLIGIESPGLTSTPVIAERVSNIVKGHLDLHKKTDFDPARLPIIKFFDLDDEQQAALIARNPDWGEVICRCEKITRYEILQALNNPLGVRTFKGIKYRARATMGRCQGGYCTAKLTAILQNDFGLAPQEITLSGEGSGLFAGMTREVKDIDCH